MRVIKKYKVLKRWRLSGDHSKNVSFSIKIQSF